MKFSQTHKRSFQIDSWFGTYAKGPQGAYPNSKHKLTRPWSQHPYAHGAVRLASQMLGALPFRIVMEDKSFMKELKEAKSMEELNLAEEKLTRAKKHSVKSTRELDVPLIRLTDHPFAQLFSKVNPLMASSELWTAIVSHMIIEGNAMLIFVGRNGRLLPNEVPTEIFVKSFHSFKYELDDETGLVKKWLYKAKRKTNLKGGAKIDYETVEYEPHEICHLRIYNPDNEFWGGSPLQSAFDKMEQDLEADAWNKGWFKNGAEPGVVLTTESDDLDPDDAKGILQMWESRHNGSEARNRTAVLTHGLKVDRSPITHKDMEFSTLMEANRDAICAALLVHKAALGVTDSLNKATIEEANRMVWRNLLLPMASYIEDKLFTNLFGRFDAGRVYGVFDTAGISELQTDWTEKATTAKALGDIGIPLNDVNELLNLGLPKYEWGDEAYTQANQVPFSVLSDPFGPLEEADKENEEVANNPKPTEEVDEKIIYQATKSADLVEGDTSKPWTLQGEARTLAANAIADAFWRKSRADSGEKKITKICRKTFYEYRKAQLKELDKWARSSETLESRQIPDVSSVLIDPERFGRTLRDRMAPILEDVAKGSFDAMRGEISQSVAFNLTDSAWVAFMEEKLLKVVGITTTIGDEIRKTLSAGWQNGEGLDELQERVKKAFNNAVQPYRTQRIARTETAIVANGVRDQYMDSAGIKKKMWLTAGGGDIRDSHLEYEAMGAVPFDLDYNVGLPYPGSPGGDPSEIINCRCVHVAVQDDKE